MGRKRRRPPKQGRHIQGVRYAAHDAGKGRSIIDAPHPAHRARPGRLNRDGLVHAIHFTFKQEADLG
jgi:hypothetical protein